MRLGVIVSQPEELEWLVEPIEHKEVVDVCGRVFYEFDLQGLEVVAVFSHWGKVASAVTVSVLVERFKPDFVVSVGLGSAVVPELKVGDIVVGQRLFQHDMDMRPLFRRYEVPLSGVTSYITQEHDQQLATDAVHNLLKQFRVLRQQLPALEALTPQLHLGDIACGDLLIAGAARKAAINRNLPSVLCVDMESAAMAQTCSDFAIPFVFVRTIADAADESTDNELAEKFKSDISARYNVAILQYLFEQLHA